MKNVTNTVSAHLVLNAEEWNFWHSIVAACLNDTIISSYMENTLPGKLGLLEKGESITESMIEKLWSHVEDQ